MDSDDDCLSVDDLHRHKFLQPSDTSGGDDGEEGIFVSISISTTSVHDP